MSHDFVAQDETLENADQETSQRKESKSKWNTGKGGRVDDRMWLSFQVS